MAVDDIPSSNTSDKPKLVVFDLDYTLWPFWCDTHVRAPIKPTLEGDSVIDKSGDQFSFYREVPDVLRSIRDDPDMEMCVASRTHAPTIAQNMLSMLRIDDKPSSALFSFTAWGTGSKVQHFQELHLHTGIEYKDMIFFDDELRNKDVERCLGVQFVHVTDGVSHKTLWEGIDMWRTREKKLRKSGTQKGNNNKATKHNKKG